MLLICFFTNCMHGTQNSSLQPRGTWIARLQTPISSVFGVPHAYAPALESTVAQPRTCAPEPAISIPLRADADQGLRVYRDFRARHERRQALLLELLLLLIPLRLEFRLLLLPAYRVVLTRQIDPEGPPLPLQQDAAVVGGVVYRRPVQKHRQAGDLDVAVPSPNLAEKRIDVVKNEQIGRPEYIAKRLVE